jgi:hypothetical protein
MVGAVMFFRDQKNLSSSTSSFFATMTFSLFARNPREALEAAKRNLEGMIENDPVGMYYRGNETITGLRTVDNRPTNGHGFHH